MDYAGKTDRRTSSRRCPRGEIAQYASRRIRARRDSPRKGRQTRRSVAQASHRHRSLQGQARRRQTETSATRKDFGQHSTKSYPGLREGSEPFRPQALGPTLSRQKAGFEKRRPRGCVASLSFSAGEIFSPQTRLHVASQSSHKGQPYPKKPQKSSRLNSKLTTR